MIHANNLSADERSAAKLHFRMALQAGVSQRSFFDSCIRPCAVRQSRI